MKRTLTAASCTNLALEVIKKAGELGLTKRKPRLLLSYELEILNNDLAILGMRHKRMSEMLKFFYKSWADLNDAQGWLITGEETQLERYLSETLEFQESMLVEEAAPVACKLLEEHDQLARAVGIDEIELMDAHMASKAAQKMCVLLTGGNILLHATDEEPVAFAQAYPHSLNDDFAEYSETEKPHPCKLTKQVEQTPQDEFAFIANKVAAALQAGVKPEKIFISVPNSTWARCVSKALNSANIENTQRASDAALHADLTNKEECSAAQALCLLSLVANEKDATSWRSWCGFGKHLAYNDFFDELWRYGRKNNLKFMDCMQRLHDEGKKDFDLTSNATFGEVMARYSDGLRAIEICAPLAGSELMQTICKLVAYTTDASNKAYNALLKLYGQSSFAKASAQEIHECIRTRLTKRPWVKENCVKIGRIEDIYGADIDIAIASGMVDGFVPDSKTIDITQTLPEKRKRIETAHANKLTYLLNHCKQEVITTSFELIEARLAEQFKLGVKRIQILEGERVARVTQSSVLQQF